MTETRTCQRCNGLGEVAALAYSDGGCHETPVPCLQCGGAGTISREQAAREVAGRVMREYRIGAQLTLDDVATAMTGRFGEPVSPAWVSRVERGQQPISAGAAVWLSECLALESAVLALLCVGYQSEAAA